MFYDVNGEIIHVLMEEETGYWAISYDNPKSPFFISCEQIKKYHKIAAPKEYIYNNNPNRKKTKAELERLEIIKPLIENDSYIKFKKERKNIVIQLANTYHTTEKRIFRLYYLYLAKRILIEQKTGKKRLDEIYQKDFEWAIHSFYYSAQRLSLQTTYDMLLLTKYTTQDGKLKDKIPSWNSFRYFFYQGGYHKNIRKEISREGLTHYQRNSRPILGTAMKWKTKIGYYQMDATVADVYIVSRFDRKAIIGRPNIYFAVDIVSQLIAGIYVGLENGGHAVMMCLVNAAENKVDFCNRYGITITEDQWPSRGLPKGIVVDKGSEFVNGLSEELCKTYGLEIESLPPFRPDDKSLVEKSFDVIQSKYKPLLSGKGVIGKDVQERWSIDYRKQATLNLDEFIRIVINCVIYINSARIMESYIYTSEMVKDEIASIPNKIWNWYEKNNDSALIPVDDESLYLMSLKRKKASISRKGILYNGIYYKNNRISQILSNIKGSSVTVAYDEDNIKYIYMVQEGEYIKFVIPDEYMEFSSYSVQEYKMMTNEIKQRNKILKQNETQKRVLLLKEINDIVSSAVKETDNKKSIKNIKENRDNERNKLS